MNLKEAFRYQNKLQSLMGEARMILMDDKNVTTQQTTLLKKRYMAEADDEIRIEEAPSESMAEAYLECRCFSGSRK